MRKLNVSISKTPFWALIIFGPVCCYAIVAFWKYASNETSIFFLGCVYLIYAFFAFITLFLIYDAYKCWRVRFDSIEYDRVNIVFRRNDVDFLTIPFRQVRSIHHKCSNNKYFVGIQELENLRFWIPNSEEYKEFISLCEQYAAFKGNYDDFWNG